LRDWGAKTKRGIWVGGKRENETFGVGAKTKIETGGQ